MRNRNPKVQSELERRWGRQDDTGEEPSEPPAVMSEV